MRKIVSALSLAILLSALCLPSHTAAEGAATPAPDVLLGTGIVDSAGCHMLALEYVGEGQQPSATPSRSWSCTLGHYVAGQVVTMTARPGAGAVVAGWSGTTDDNGTSIGNIVVMPSDDHLVLVTYASPVASERIWLPLLLR